MISAIYPCFICLFVCLFYWLQEDTMPSDIDGIVQLTCGALNNPQTRPVIVFIDAVNQVSIHPSYLLSIPSHLFITLTPWHTHSTSCAFILLTFSLSPQIHSSLSDMHLPGEHSSILPSFYPLPSIHHSLTLWYTLSQVLVLVTFLLSPPILSPPSYSLALTFPVCSQSAFFFIFRWYTGVNGLNCILSTPIPTPLSPHYYSLSVEWS